MKLKYDKTFFVAISPYKLAKVSFSFWKYFHSQKKIYTLFLIQEISYMYNNFKTLWNGKENCLELSLGFTVYTKLHRP